MNVPELHEVPDLTVQTSAVSVFDQVSPVTVAKAQTKDSVLGMIIQYVQKGKNQRTWPFKKLGVKQDAHACYSLINW